MHVGKLPLHRKPTLLEQIKRIGRRVLSAGPEFPIALAISSAVVLVSLLVGLYFVFPGVGDGLAQGVYVEATGFLLDLLFFGVVLAFVLRWQDKRQSILRYLEEIQDFKRWNTDEGRLRIAGAVRRLSALGRTSIDFVGMKLSDFSFKHSDIKSIQESKFYEGEWGNLSSREEVELTRVDFSHVNCSKVLFSRFNPLEGFGIAPPVVMVDCSFQNSDLRKAVFDGSAMKWTSSPPSSLYEEFEYEDGTPGSTQAIYPAFDGADLTGASFKTVTFDNADFRNANNLLLADFAGARGLNSCAFDDASTRAEIMARAKNPPKT